jgi:hypothetical protein
MKGSMTPKTGALIKHALSATEPTIDELGYYHFPFVDPLLHRYFRAKKTRAGYVIVTVEAECDPIKRDPAWHERMIALMGHKDYRREHRLDWTSSSGEIYYPEFAQDPRKYVNPGLGFTKDAPVYRGWDFGIRHPACVWAQVVKGNLHILREVLPEQIDGYSFCKLVLYLSGQLEESVLQRYPRAYRWMHKIQGYDAQEYEGKELAYPQPPWFEPGTRFLDFAGPEVYNPHSNVEKEGQERNDFEILASNGIYLGVMSTRVKARAAIIRKLLLPSPGAPPRFQISPHCRDLCAGMAGGISYKKGTEMDPEPEEPSKDGYFEHLHDALGYLLVNVLPVIEEQGDPPKAGPVREASELHPDLERQTDAFMDTEIFVDPEEGW